MTKSPPISAKIRGIVSKPTIPKINASAMKTSFFMNVNFRPAEPAT